MVCIAIFTAIIITDLNFSLFEIIDAYFRSLVVLYVFNVQVMAWALVRRLLFNGYLTWFSMNDLETIYFLLSHNNFCTCNWNVCSDINRCLEVCLIWTLNLCIYTTVISSYWSFLTFLNNLVILVLLGLGHFEIGIKSLHITFVKQVLNVNFLLVFRLWFFQRWIMLRIRLLRHFHTSYCMPSFLFLHVVVKVDQVIKKRIVVLVGGVMVLIYKSHFNIVDDLVFLVSSLLCIPLI